MEEIKFELKVTVNALTEGVDSMRGRIVDQLSKAIPGATKVRAKSTGYILSIYYMPYHGENSFTIRSYDTWFQAYEAAAWEVLYTEYSVGEDIRNEFQRLLKSNYKFDDVREFFAALDLAGANDTGNKIDYSIDQI